MGEYNDTCIYTQINCMREVISNTDKYRESVMEQDSRRNEKFCPRGKCFVSGKMFLNSALKIKQQMGRWRFKEVMPYR